MTSYYSARRRRELEAPKKTAAEPLGPDDSEACRTRERLDVLVVAAALASIISDEAGRRVDVRAEERVARLEKQLAQKRDEHTRLSATSELQMWKTELELLRPALEAHVRARSIDPSESF